MVQVLQLDPHPKHNYCCLFCPDLPHPVLQVEQRVSGERSQSAQLSVQASQAVESAFNLNPALQAEQTSLVEQVTQLAMVQASQDLLVPSKAYPTVEIHPVQTPNSATAHVQLVAVHFLQDLL